MIKEKIQMKYSFRAKPKDLFICLSNPSFLQNWIAPQVKFDEETGLYTFIWQRYKESAKIIEKANNKFIKYEWVGGDRQEHEYVSFRIDQIPGDEWIDLYVEDFCEPSEKKSLLSGWEKQIRRLEILLK